LEKHKEASEGTYASRFAPHYHIFVVEDLLKDGREETILYQLQYRSSSNIQNLEKTFYKKSNLVKFGNRSFWEMTKRKKLFKFYTDILILM